MRIALVEDDLAQAELMQVWLEASEHQCRHQISGQAFIKMVRQESFDLLIIDWCLPDMSGIEILKWVRDHLDWPIPVLFATSRNEEADIVLALESGADDYMVKPVKRSEMLARINALGRRSQTGAVEAQILEFGIYTVDQNRHIIRRSDEAIEMTQKEYDLAVFLFQNSGRLVSRGHILESVWGRNPDLNTRTVDTHVSRIRHKLHLGPESGWRLSTVYQHGYRLENIETQ